jgi:hypothetical protein
MTPTQMRNDSCGKGGSPWRTGRSTDEDDAG